MTRWNTKDLTGTLQAAQKEPKARPVGCGRVSCDPAFRPNPCGQNIGTWIQLLGVKASVALPKWEFTIHAKPDFGRRGDHQKGMVA